MKEQSELLLESTDIPELELRNVAHQFAGESEGVAFMDLREGGSTMYITRGGELFLSRRINSKLEANIMKSELRGSTKSRLTLELSAKRTRIRKPKNKVRKLRYDQTRVNSNQSKGRVGTP